MRCPRTARPRGPSINPVVAVIVDLDGTLVDTAGEIGVALNRTLADYRLALLSQDEVVALIGRGVHSLVERAILKRHASDLDVEAVVEDFHSHYAQTVATEAQLYPGALEGIAALHESGRKLAIATNKPRWYTERLLASLKVDALFDAVFAGDDGIVRKPAPDMLLAACAKVGCDVKETLMLGDSDNDVLAARAAGCRVWCVPYGYNEGRSVESLGCDRIVSSIAEAAAILAGFPPPRE